MPTLHDKIQDNHLQVMHVMARLLGAEFSPEVARLIADDFKPDGLPFDEGQWAFDPDLISQMKKIVNALYHLERLALLIDGKVALGNGSLMEMLRCIPSLFYQDIPGLQGHVYEIIRLLTHVDVDFSGLFRQELAALMPLIQPLQTMAWSSAAFDTARQLGEATGNGVMQLSQMNYTFLTQLVFLLPSYLARMKAGIDACANEARIAREDMDAPQMVQWLDGLQIAGVRLSNNRLYLDYFRPLFALQTGILNELAHLNGASAHVVLEKVAQMKEKFSTVVACVDELEVTLGLRPGLMSAPLVQMVDEIHQEGVNAYWESGIELPLEIDALRLIDESFTNNRLAQAFRRNAEDGLACEQLDEVMNQCDRFFNTLYQYDLSTRLNQLDDAVKVGLIEPFRSIQPYLAVVDITLSNAIVKSLLTREEPGVFDSLYSKNYPDRLTNILRVKYALAAHISKLKQTHLFRQQLNISLINTLEGPDLFIPINFFRERIPSNAPRTLGPLVPDLDAEKRATRVVKTLMLSETVCDIRRRLAATLGVLSPVMQTQLNGARTITGSLPFPEINTHYLTPNLNEAIEGLKQPRELISFKLVMNALYFLEQACHQYELLDERDLKITHIKTSLEVARYAALAGQTLAALPADDHYLSQARALIASANTSIQGILALRRDYKPDDGWDLELRVVGEWDDFPDSAIPDQDEINRPPVLIQYGDTYWLYGNTNGAAWQLTQLDATVVAESGLRFDDAHVPYNRHLYALYQEITLKNAHAQPRYDAVFSIVNALTLLPQQLDAGLQGLDHETVDAAHRVAKDVSDEMRRMLDAFNQATPAEMNGIQVGFQHALRLFLETSAAFAWIQGIVGKVNDALRAVRDAHGTTVDHLGLIYRDLLTPILLEVDQWEERLGLQSGLLSRPLKQMLDVYYQGILTPIGLNTNRHIALATHTDDFVRRMDAARTRQDVANHQLAALNETKERVDALIHALSRYSKYSEDEKEGLVRLFRTDYLPILNDATLSCQAVYAQVDLSNAPMMDWLNMDNDAQRASGLSLLRIRQADLIGQIASQELVREAVVGQISHLQVQLMEQARLNIAFKRKCIAASLHRQSQLFAGVSAGFDDALSRFVNGLEQEVFDSVEQAEDIDMAIAIMLDTKIIRFETEQGCYYRQLVAIQQAVDQMNAYMISQQAELILHAHVGLSSGFESQATLGTKRALLEEIERWIVNPALTAHDKVAGIHAIIHQNGFESTLLAYERYDAFTYGWLVQCVTSFLELICLYKPEPKVAYEKLKAEIGFFRLAPAGAAAAVPQDPALAMGA